MCKFDYNFKMLANTLHLFLSFGNFFDEIKTMYQSCNTQKKKKSYQGYHTIQIMEIIP